MPAEFSSTALPAVSIPESSVRMLKLNTSEQAKLWQTSRRQINSLTNFNKFSIFLQDLEIPKPNSIVSNAERDDMINEWFTTRVMMWCTERLQHHHQ